MSHGESFVKNMIMKERGLYILQKEMILVKSLYSINALVAIIEQLKEGCDKIW